jgi:hypothetical protein
MMYPASKILPSIHVSMTELDTCLDHIKYLLTKTHFVAFDAEFSGLGAAVGSSKIHDLEERYNLLRNVVIDYAVVSFGISLFEKDVLASNEENVQYHVSNFNFMLHRYDDYKVTPKSLKFLVENGLDIQQQISTGIPYIPLGSEVS